MTKSCTDGHDQGLVHLNDAILLVVIQEDATLFVVAAEKLIINTSISSSFHAKSFGHFGRKSILRTKKSITALCVSERWVQRNCFSSKVFSLLRWETRQPAWYRPSQSISSTSPSRPSWLTMRMTGDISGRGRVIPTWK